MKREIFRSLKELEAKYLFYHLGPCVAYNESSWSQAVWIRGNHVGTLICENKKSEIMSVLEAEEGEG